MGFLAAVTSLWWSCAFVLLLRVIGIDISKPPPQQGALGYTQLHVLGKDERGVFAASVTNQDAETPHLLAEISCRLITCGGHSMFTCLIPRLSGLAPFSTNIWLRALPPISQRACKRQPWLPRRGIQRTR